MYNFPLFKNGVFVKDNMISVSSTQEIQCSLDLMTLFSISKCAIEDTERRHSNMLLDMYFIFLFLQLCINQTFALRNYTNSQRWHEGYRKHIFQKYIFASISRQIDNKSRVLKEEKGVRSSQSGERGLEFLRRRKGQTFFIYILSVQSVQFSRSVVSDSL